MQGNTHVAIFMTASSFLAPSTSSSLPSSMPPSTANFSATTAAVTTKPTRVYVDVGNRNHPVLMDHPRGPRILNPGLTSWSYCANWSTLVASKRDAALQQIARQNLIRMDDAYRNKEDVRSEQRWECDDRRESREKRVVY